MKVWIAMRGWPYEGSDLLGVYSTLVKAKKACQSDGESKRLTWRRDTTGDAVNADAYGGSYFYLVRTEVDS